MIFCKSGKKNSFHRVANFHSVACWTKIFRKILTKMFCKKLTIICILWKLQNIPHDSRREIMEVFFYLAHLSVWLSFELGNLRLPKFRFFINILVFLREKEVEGGMRWKQTCVFARGLKVLGQGSLKWSRWQKVVFSY